MNLILLVVRSFTDLFMATILLLRSVSTYQLSFSCYLFLLNQRNIEISPCRWILEEISIFSCNSTRIPAKFAIFGHHILRFHLKIFEWNFCFKNFEWNCCLKNFDFFSFSIVPFVKPEFSASTLFMFVLNKSFKNHEFFEWKCWIVAIETLNKFNCQFNLSFQFAVPNCYHLNSKTPTNDQWFPFDRCNG